MILRTNGDNIVRWAEDQMTITETGTFTPSRTFPQYTTANAAVLAADPPVGFAPHVWSYNGSWAVADAARKSVIDDERASKANPVPAAVPAVAFRLALAQFGFLDDVEAAIAAAAAGGNDEARVRWEYAVQFERSHPLIESFRVALGKTDAEVDDLFRLAKSLS